MMAEEKEWEETKKVLLRMARQPFQEAEPSYDMLVNAAFARALRLIMEKLEGS